MIFHFGALLYSLAFYFFLAWMTGRLEAPSWTFYLSAAAPLVILSVVAARRLTGRFMTAFLPAVISFSTPLLLLLVDTGRQQTLFLFAASILYYFSLLGIYRVSQNPVDQTARAMQNLGAIGSLLFVYASAYGFYLNFDVPLWLLMAVYFLATALVSFQTLLGASRERRYVLLLSSILGLVFGELVWFLHFWPLGYLTTGVATLLLYYWMWKAVSDTLRENFSTKQFLFESAVLAVLFLLLLLSSPWRMLV